MGLHAVSHRDKVMAIATVQTNQENRTLITVENCPGERGERNGYTQYYTVMQRKAAPMIIDKNEAIGRSENV
jgi:hypothetical protein